MSKTRIIGSNYQSSMIISTLNYRWRNCSLANSYLNPLPRSLSIGFRKALQEFHCYVKNAIVEIEHREIIV